MERLVYLQALESIKLMEKNHDRTRCQNLSVVGDSIAKIGCTACAAGLRGYSVKRPVEEVGGHVEAITSMTSVGYRQSYYPKVENPEDYTNFFFNWLLWRSPYSPCIVTKKVKYAVEHGIVYDTHYPNNLIVGAITASRCAWEHSELMASMYYLVQAGMNESAAFYLAHIVKCTSKYTLSTCESSCHAAICYNMTSFASLKNFCSGKMIKQGKDYVDCLTYDNIQIAWGDEGKKLQLSDLIGLADLEGNGPALPNPFARSLNLNDNKRISGLDDVKKLCDAVNKFIKDGE